MGRRDFEAGAADALRGDGVAPFKMRRRAQADYDAGYRFGKETKVYAQRWAAAVVAAPPGAPVTDSTSLRNPAGYAMPASGPTRRVAVWYRGAPLDTELDAFIEALETSGRIFEVATDGIDEEMN